MANEIRQTVIIEASLTKIQQDLKRLEGDFRGSFARIQSAATAAFNVLGVGLGVGALVAFGKKVIDLGDQLSDLSDQTGLSVEVLGGIRPVLDASNSSLDGFAKGIAKAQKNLGDISGDGKQAAEAFKAIALNARDLAALSPDQFLEKFVGALAKVENRNERLAIATRVLGKSAAELIPTILQLAENGIPKLDKASADAYLALGQFKDQLAFVGAGLIDFGAKLIEPYARLVQFTTAFLGLRNLSKEEQFGKFAADINTFTGNVSRSTGIAVGKIEGMSDAALNEMAKTSDAATKVAIDNLVKTRQAFDKIKGSMDKPAGGAPIKDLLAGADDSKIKKLEAALQSYRESLIKTITAQEIEAIKLTFGEEAALKAAQAYQVLGLRASLAADKLPIPPQVQKSASEAEATLKSLGANVQVLGEKNFGALQSGALTGAAAIDALKQSIDTGSAAVQAFADAANEGVGIQFLSREDVARQHEELKRLTDQFRDLQKTLSIDILPPDQQGAAKAVQEFEERVKAINEFRDAAIRAGKDVAQVNAEAAQASADAWVAASQRMKESADEQSEFTRRAFERGFDAVSDGLRDLAERGVKNWQDAGKKILNVINSIIADQATLELKKIFLGEDFGKKGAQIGGIVGDLLGIKKPQSARLPGTTSADVLDAERGQELIQAANQTAIAAIQAESSTAQAALQAISTEATTAIQTQAATGQTTLETAAAAANTGIQTTGATAQSAIEAVKIVAIAAIEAAKASGAPLSGSSNGSIPIFGNLFGGSGGGDVFAGGATGYEAGFFHSGGDIQPGKNLRRVQQAVIMHSGGEVPVIAKRGEFMISDWSAARIGAPSLNYMNATGKIPLQQDRTRKSNEDGNLNVTNNFYNANFTDRTSVGQIEARLAAAVQRGNRQR